MKGNSLREWVIMMTVDTPFFVVRFFNFLNLFIYLIMQIYFVHLNSLSATLSKLCVYIYDSDVMQ